VSTSQASEGHGDAPRAAAAGDVDPAPRAELDERLGGERAVRVEDDAVVDAHLGLDLARARQPVALPKGAGVEPAKDAPAEGLRDLGPSVAALVTHLASECSSPPATSFSPHLPARCRSTPRQAFLGSSAH
jgi:hypothetical protein